MGRAVILDVVCCDCLKDELESMEVRLAGEERKAIKYFSEDAADSPHVNRSAV